MRTEYGVRIPRNQYGRGKYATIFWDFYDSEHQTVKFSFESVEEAKKLYKSSQNIISRNAMMDIRARMIGCDVYFEKYSIGN